MQKIFYFPVFTLMLGLSFCIKCCGQGYEDSVMIANSIQLKIEPKKGLFGLSKPTFGNFTTLSVNKIDSGFYKKKVKDSSSLDLELGSGENDLNHSKYMTIQKTKWYKLLLASDSDTMNATFAIASVSKEKRQTFLGKMLSKNNEGKDEVLNYSRDVPGFISTGQDSVQWNFFIQGFSSGSRSPSSLGSASISSGYLENGSDSLCMQIYSSFTADLILINKNREHVAALKFKQKPLYTWIRNDLQNNYREAIAGLFAVIIAIADF